VVNTVEVYNCNTYMQTQHHSKNGEFDTPGIGFDWKKIAK
jgi:hypothetical protein